jgi:hypothetical protein
VSQLRLERRDQKQYGQERQAFQDPPRNQQIHVRGHKRADPEPDDGDREPERPSLSAPTEQDVQRSAEDQEVGQATPDKRVIIQRRAWRGNWPARADEKRIGP